MSNTQTAAPKDFGWALVELMGHRQRVGQVREEEIAGSLLLRIDVPTEGEDYITEYYGASAIYALRPMSEEVARAHWAASDPRPSRPAEYRPTLQLAASRDDNSTDSEPEDDGMPF